MAKKNIQKKEGILKRGMDFLNGANTKFVIGLLFGALAVYLCFSFLSFFSSGGADQSEIDMASSMAGNVENSTGRSGAVVADFLVNGCFGWSSVLIVPLVVVFAMRLMNLRRPPLVKWFVGVVFGIIWGSLFSSFAFDSVMSGSFIAPGGAHGRYVLSWLAAQIGTVGVLLVLLVTLLLFLIYLTRETIVWLRKLFSIGFAKRESSSTSDDKPVGRDDEEHLVADENDAPECNYEIAETEESAEFSNDDSDNALVDNPTDNDDADDAADDSFVVDFPVNDDESDNGPLEETDIVMDDDELAKRFDAMSNKISDGNEIEMDVEQATGDEDTGGEMYRPINPKDELSYYKPPTVDLLDKYENATQSIDMHEQNTKKEEIVKALKNFGIEIGSIKATVGPTITLYEITPAQGVRISKIRNLEDDIAMSLEALCIRIIAPIPGKGAIGIEVPNANKQIVSMASLLNSRKYKETDMALPLALGKTISNEVFMVDMAKMPHLLVAGATGMGKSVGLNAIITSLLYKMHPAYLKFVMVDPKMVELSLYNVLEKHFLAKLEDEGEPIITDVTKVVRTLKSLCTEMDNRYMLLKDAKVRSLKEYNEKFLQRELLPTKGHRFMPYIVVIIDEYGDLMMTAGKEVEQPIARIAQKARAVGIHMIIATQRPTTNIVTGTIKANFPARMAFRVMAQIDSRTILDRSGANQLQGKGDMLFLAGNDPVRVQCALVETKEVERVCDYISRQQGYPTAYILPEPVESSEPVGGGASSSRGEIKSDKLDALFADAARTVVLHQQGSVSLLQRKFNVGFNRAGRIMDQLCQTGIVGEQDGSKPRQVLCPDEADLEFRLKSLLGN